MREESEELKLTVSQAANLTGVAEAELRERLGELVAGANGGRPGVTPGGAELERISPARVPDRPPSRAVERSGDLTLDLVARLEAQAAEISRLTTIASKAESLARALSGEREEREELEGKLEATRSELDALRSHILGLHARHHHRLGLETELVRTQAELAAANAQLSDAQTTWRDLLSSKLKVGQSRRGQQSDEVKRRQVALEAELVEVRTALERAQQRVAELEERDTERASLQQQLAAAQAELENARARISELADRRSRRTVSSLAHRLGLGR